MRPSEMEDEFELDKDAHESEDQDTASAGGSSTSGTDPSLETMIDEAVEAVEAVARRRGEDLEDADHPGDESPQSGDVQQLQGEVSMLRDRLLRTLADFDNFRKRVEREREEERKYAAVEPLREVLGIVDNLERALAAEGDVDDLREGVEMILRQMEDLLRRSGVTVVDALKKPFDPAFHEAVSRIEDDQVDAPTVVDEMQRGYVIHGRLLRPSIVRVAVPAAVAEAETEEDRD